MRDHVAPGRPVSARLRRCVAACAAQLALLAACGGAPDDPVTESTRVLDLQGDQAPELRKSLAAGTWLVEVSERGIDVRTTILQPGHAAVELLESAPRHGTVHSVVSLDDPGEVVVTVRSDDHPMTRGQASVRIARFRPGESDESGAMLAGYRAWAQADAEHALATPESWARAADKLNEAIQRFEDAGSSAARGGAAYALAALQYTTREDYAAAIRASEIASESFADAEDEVGVQNASIVRAGAEIDFAAGLDGGTQRAEQKALYDIADRRLADAMDFFVGRQMPSRAALASNLRGVRAYNLGANDIAAAHFSRARELAVLAREHDEQVKALMNMAWLHRQQGQVRQAADEYASLMQLLDASKQTYLYGTALNNYGFCLIALGDFDRALELHTQALELFTRLDQKAERATQLVALGTLYFRVGDAHRALETLRTAIFELGKLSDNRSLLSALRIAGHAASAINQHDLALEYLRRSTAIDSNPHDVGRTRVLIAGELRQIGDLRSAEKELERVSVSANSLVKAEMLAERARLRQAQKRLDEALEDMRAADASYRELGLEFSRIDTSASLAQLLLAHKDLAGAAAAADEAVAIVARLRVNSANPEWRARFLSTQYAPFEARIAVDLAAGAEGEQSFWNAFRTADEVRARALADRLASAVAGRQPEVAETVQLRDKLTAQQLRLEARVQNPQSAADQTMELRREIAETRARLDESRARSEPVRESSVRLPAALAEVQKKLPADTLVLAYFVGDGHSHVWLLSKNKLRHADIPGRSRLQQAIDAAAASSGPPAEVRQAERRLASLLVGGLVDGTGEKKLLVIPDGPLNGVPFAALPLPSQPESTLLDRYVIGYAPSLSLAFAHSAEARARGLRVAVISDPVYAPDDRRLPAAGAPGNWRSPPPSTNRLTRLPYSVLEARAVQDTFGAQGTISLAGFEATRQRVLELAGAELSVLHFATHAVARNDAPERSALYLSEYAADGSLMADSQLTTSDIMSSGLRARVVVLSGCATGDGSTLRGEGVLGLAYAFLANGSGAVVASLWPVEDASTARLMNDFYRAYRAHGNAAEALRSAQLRGRATGKSGAWSSFVVRANGFP